MCASCVPGGSAAEEELPSEDLMLGMVGRTNGSGWTELTGVRSDRGRKRIVANRLEKDVPRTPVKRDARPVADGQH
jgi:hypothetical protein